MTTWSPSSSVRANDRRGWITSVDLVVMAAGMGSRYGGLKQLEQVGPHGERLLDYAVHDAWKSGVRRVVFVIRKETEQEFHEAVGARYAGAMEVAYAFQSLGLVPEGFAVPPERRKPWGTGHAVLAAAQAVASPFVLINADDFYGPTAIRRLAEFLHEPRNGARERCAMVAFELAKTLSAHGAVARGVCEVDERGCLSTIREHVGVVPGKDGAAELDTPQGRRILAGDTPVSMNCWGLAPWLFDAFGEAFGAFLRARGGDPAAEFFLPTAINELVRMGRLQVEVLRTPDRWVGLTYREDAAATRAHLAELVARGVYPSPLWGEGSPAS